MSRIFWAPQALEDVRAIRSYLSGHSIEYADLVVERIFDIVSRLERHPRSGRVVPEFGKAWLREMILGTYRIVYRVRRRDVLILTVFHAARRFPTG